MARKDEEEKRNRLLVLVGAVVLVISLWILGATIREEKPAEVIDSFEKCVAAGFPVMESYPRQCRTLQGDLFIEQIGG